MRPRPAVCSSVNFSLSVSPWCCLAHSITRCMSLSASPSLWLAGCFSLFRSLYFPLTRCVSPPSLPLTLAFFRYEKAVEDFYGYFAQQEVKPPSKPTYRGASLLRNRHSENDRPAFFRFKRGRKTIDIFFLIFQELTKRLRFPLIYGEKHEKRSPCFLIFSLTALAALAPPPTPPSRSTLYCPLTLRSVLALTSTPPFASLSSLPFPYALADPDSATLCISPSGFRV